MNIDQIVKRKRTLHRNPTPAEYGIVLERTAVKKPGAEEKTGTAGFKKPQGSLAGSQDVTSEKKAVKQSSLDEILSGDLSQQAGRTQQKQGQQKQGQQKQEWKQQATSAAAGQAGQNAGQKPGASQGSAGRPGTVGTGTGNNINQGTGRTGTGKNNMNPGTGGPGTGKNNMNPGTVGTGTGQNRQKTPPPRKGGRGKTILIAYLALVALGVAYRISAGAGSSSSSSNTSTLPPIQAPDITLTPATGADSSADSSDQEGDADQSSNSILDQLGGSNGSGDASGEKSEAVSVSEETGSVSPDTAYTEIVQTYASLLARDSQTFTEAYDRGDYEQAADADVINYELVYAYFNYPDYTEAHYGLRDYNEDETPELVIALSSDGGSWTQIWAGYTFDGSKAVPLFTGDTKLGYRIDLYTLPDNSFLIHGGGGALAGSDTICRIEDGGTGLLVLEKYWYDEQANGNMDHRSSSRVMTDEEFTEKYYDVQGDATAAVVFFDVKQGAVVQSQ